MEEFFEKCVSFEHNFKMDKSQKLKEEDKNIEENQYEGEMIDGLAEGQGKQILVQQAITYSGKFKNGKKHGGGYLVNENLDTLECEFIEDELAGI